MNTYKVIGLITLFVFYFSYYAKMFKQSKRGIKTDQMARGSKSKKTFLVERILKLTTFIMAGVQFISILFMAKLPVFIENDLIRQVGILISTLGVIVFIVAMITMSDSWRAGVDNKQKTKIITTGMYKYSRNPAFVGFDLFYIGTALEFSNIFNIIFTCASVLMLHLQILEEEKFLPSAFGTEYLDYKKKTGRYFGTK